MIVKVVLHREYDLDYSREELEEKCGCPLENLDSADLLELLEDKYGSRMTDVASVEFIESED